MARDGYDNNTVMLFILFVYGPVLKVLQAIDLLACRQGDCISQ